MQAYRTDEDAARLLAAELERETADVFRENVALATKLARTEAVRDAALERLAEAGAGAGRPSARRDRTGLGALVLAGAAVAFLPLHGALLLAMTTERTAAPVMLLLGAPGALAAAVAHRYRRVSLANRVAFAAGAAIAVTALVELVNGVSR